MCGDVCNENKMLITRQKELFDYYLTIISDGGSLSDIENAVWDALEAYHNTAGSLATKLKTGLTTGQFIALK